MAAPLAPAVSRLGHHLESGSPDLLLAIARVIAREDS